jgi:molybdopterin synthase catalytic subunit
VEVSVRLFAGLRQRAGAAELSLDLPEGARVSDLLEQVRWLTDGIPVVIAVNRDYASPELVLAAGDELALIPPVSGGSADADSENVLAMGEPKRSQSGSAPVHQLVHVRVLAEALSLDSLIERVRDPRAGALVSFSGVTREVPALEYEAYVEMAERQLAEIVAAAVSRHGLCAAAAEHRIGRVALSEASVTVAASAPHRAEAFAGAREIIDEIKARAPIWKREEGEWVAGTIPAARPSGPLRNPSGR